MRSASVDLSVLCDCCSLRSSRDLLRSSKTPARGCSQLAVTRQPSADPTSTEGCQRFALVVHNAHCTARADAVFDLCFSGASAPASCPHLFYKNTLLDFAPSRHQCWPFGGTGSSTVKVPSTGDCAEQRSRQFCGTCPGSFSRDK